jgi:hypothetical protein
MEIDVAFSAWTAHAERLEKGINKIGKVAPLLRNLGIANTPSALATQTLIIPQAPAAGRMWFVHRVGILGVDGHTAAVGVADVYAGPGQEAEATGQLYSGLAIPTIIVEGRFHNPVLSNEHVYVICYNLTAQQQLQFVIGVEEYPIDSTTSLVIT